MALGFKSGKKQGDHYELAKFAVRRLEKCNLLLKGKKERDYEFAVVSNLQQSRKLTENLITQVDDEPVEKITQATLFGYKHRPDVTIGNDGTAIEIKVVNSGTAVREAIGQAIAYRMGYRFAISVLIDQKGDMIELCKQKGSKEVDLLRGLANDFNIFTVVGPVSHGKNLVFYSKK